MVVAFYKFVNGPLRNYLNSILHNRREVPYLKSSGNSEAVRTGRDLFPAHYYSVVQQPELGNSQVVPYLIVQRCAFHCKTYNKFL